VTVLLAHMAGGGGWALLAFAPAGLFLVIGLLLMIRPVVDELGRPTQVEDIDDLAVQLLGEEEAREWRRQLRRRRAVRRRGLRTATSDKLERGQDAVGR
jgi:hypothetical protein